jgi:hypothetical protein
MSTDQEHPVESLYPQRVVLQAEAGKAVTVSKTTPFESTVTSLVDTGSTSAGKPPTSGRSPPRCSSHPWCSANQTQCRGSSLTCTNPPEEHLGPPRKRGCPVLDRLNVSPSSGRVTGSYPMLNNSGWERASEIRAEKMRQETARYEERYQAKARQHRADQMAKHRQRYRCRICGHPSSGPTEDEGNSENSPWTNTAVVDRCGAYPKGLLVG